MRNRQLKLEVTWDAGYWLEQDAKSLLLAFLSLQITTYDVDGAKAGQQKMLLGKKTKVVGKS